MRYVYSASAKIMPCSAYAATTVARTFCPHVILPLQLHLPEQRPLLLTMLQHLAAATAVAQQNGENLPVRLLEATWAVFKADKNFSLVAPMVRFFTRSVMLAFLQGWLLLSEIRPLCCSMDFRFYCCHSTAWPCWMLFCFRFAGNNATCTYSSCCFLPRTCPSCLQFLLILCVLAIN